MATAQEAAYHRTFLSRYYAAQVVADIKNGAASGNTLTDDETAEIKTDSPEAFEDARKALAQLLGVQYRPAKTVTFSRNYHGDAYPSQYYDGVPSDAQVAGFLKPRNSPQANPTTGPPAIINPNVGLLNAYLNGNNLLPTTMFSKMDQEFNDYASPWEKAFSTLMAPYRSGYSSPNAWLPIVDESWQVVGHYGTVEGGRGCGLFIPAGTKQTMDDYILGGADLKDFLQKKVPIRAWPAGHVPDGHDLMPGWESGDFGVSDFTYGVRVKPNGEVYAIEVIGNREGKDTDTWQLADLLYAGKALLEVAGLGLVLIKSLGVRAAVASGGVVVLRSATAVAAKAALKALEEDLGEEVSDLVADATKDAAKLHGRTLTAQEIETLVKGKWNANLSWLKGFRNARSLAGDAKLKAIVEALKDMKKWYGKAAQIVPEGAGKGGQLFEGGAGWVRNSRTGQLVLAIERHLLQDPDELYDQVVHDIAFDLVREANGMPGIYVTATIRIPAMSVIEAYIKQGEKAISDLRGVVYGNGT